MLGQYTKFSTDSIPQIDIGSNTELIKLIRYQPDVANPHFNHFFANVFTKVSVSDISFTGTAGNRLHATAIPALLHHITVIQSSSTQREIEFLIWESILADTPELRDHNQYQERRSLNDASLVLDD